MARQIDVGNHLHHQGSRSRKGYWVLQTAIWKDMLMLEEEELGLDDAQQHVRRQDWGDK
jgi:hypothetical protein